MNRTSKILTFSWKMLRIIQKNLHKFSLSVQHIAMPRTALYCLFLAVFSFYLILPPIVHANQPLLELSLAGNAEERSAVALTLEILLAFTVLSLAPAILLTATSFTRLIIVFYFLRQAIGTNQMPPNQILISLAIFMTCAIMYPTGQVIYKDAFDPYFKEQISLVQALEKSQAPLRKFMFVHTREKDISLFYSITSLSRPKVQEDVPTLILIPAFLISELKTAFTIGFLIYIPFVMLDMVISSVLLAMGMMMLPPMSISLPFKLLLFVMVDGWNLIIGSLVNTFMQ